MDYNKRRFMEWMNSDNVVYECDDDDFNYAYWSSQDALYSNKLYTIFDAYNYFCKEFGIYEGSGNNEG